jgi:uncharacterized protein HemX
MSAWHVAWETGRTVSAILVALGLPGLLVYFVQDRRKNLAAAAVAERTVDSEVELKETGAEEARLVYVQREMDLERQFHREQLADRDKEIDRQRAELARRDDRIASLLQQVAHLEGQLAEVTRQLTSVRNQLNELAEHSPEEIR